MCDPPNYYVPPSNTPVPPPRQVIFQRRVSGVAIFGVMRPALTVSCGAFEADRSRQPARVPECKTALLVGDPRSVQCRQPPNPNRCPIARQVHQRHGPLQKLFLRLGGIQCLRDRAVVFHHLHPPLPVARGSGHQSDHRLDFHHEIIHGARRK